MVTIDGKEWLATGCWQVNATVWTPEAIRSGPLIVTLPEEATDQDIIAIVSQTYGSD